MADIDMDPFGGHEYGPDKPMGENIPLISGEGGSTWEPGRQQETSFGGEESKQSKLVKELYLKVFKHQGHPPEEFHFDNFELRDGDLYYKGNSKSFTTIKKEIRLVKEIEKILGIKRLRNLSFDILKGKVTAEQALMLNRVEEELPSASDIDKADEIEFQEITESAKKSTEDLIE